MHPSNSVTDALKNAFTQVMNNNNYMDLKVLYEKIGNSAKKTNNIPQNVLFGLIQDGFTAILNKNEPSKVLFYYSKVYLFFDCFKCPKNAQAAFFNLCSNLNEENVFKITNKNILEGLKMLVVIAEKDTPTFEDDPLSFLTYTKFDKTKTLSTSLTLTVFYSIFLEFLVSYGRDLTWIFNDADFAICSFIINRYARAGKLNDTLKKYSTTICNKWLKGYMNRCNIINKVESSGTQPNKLQVSKLKSMFGCPLFDCFHVRSIFYTHKNNFECIFRVELYGAGNDDRGDDGALSATVSLIDVFPMYMFSIYECLLQYYVSTFKLFAANFSVSDEDMFSQKNSPQKQRVYRYSSNIKAAVLAILETQRDCEYADIIKYLNESLYECLKFVVKIPNPSDIFKVLFDFCENLYCSLVKGGFIKSACRNLGDIIKMFCVYTKGNNVVSIKVLTKTFMQTGDVDCINAILSVLSSVLYMDVPTHSINEDVNLVLSSKQSLVPTQISYGIFLSCLIQIKKLNPNRFQLIQRILKMYNKTSRGFDIGKIIACILLVEPNVQFCCGLIKSSENGPPAVFNLLKVVFLMKNGPGVFVKIFGDYRSLKEGKVNLFKYIGLMLTKQTRPDKETFARCLSEVFTETDHLSVDIKERMLSLHDVYVNI